MSEDEKKEALAELDAIAEDLRAGYPDLVDMEPSESYPASIMARAMRVRDLIS